MISVSILFEIGNSPEMRDKLFKLSNSYQKSMKLLKEPEDISAKQKLSAAGNRALQLGRSISYRLHGQNPETTMKMAGIYKSMLQRAQGEKK